MNPAPTQRIVPIRREYNAWVADETIEDYALRYTPQSFRKWSEFRVENTALGAISFLALEAIGASISLDYGFLNAFWAIVLVGTFIVLTGIPIAVYAARHAVDIDLLTRGSGFGYLGSTFSSLVYASFTFIFFPLEAFIMAAALELGLGMPLWLGYLVCSVIVIPLVMHGITMLSRLQAWTQPHWLVLLILQLPCPPDARASGPTGLAGVQRADRAGVDQGRRLRRPEGMLGFCASFAVAWIGALVADLVVNKPPGLGTVLALSAFVGAFGHGTL